MGSHFIEIFLCGIGYCFKKKLSKTKQRSGRVLMIFRGNLITFSFGPFGGSLATKIFHSRPSESQVPGRGFSVGASVRMYLIFQNSVTQCPGPRELSRTKTCDVEGLAFGPCRCWLAGLDQEEITSAASWWTRKRSNNTICVIKWKEQQQPMAWKLKKFKEHPGPMSCDRPVHLG